MEFSQNKMEEIKTMKIKKDELKRIIRERIYDNTQVKNYKGFDI